MSKAGSTSKVEAIHNKLCDVFSDALDDFDPKEKGAAALLNVMRQFVKDNNVEAVEAPGSRMGALAEKVAEFPFDPAEDARPN